MHDKSLSLFLSIFSVFPEHDSEQTLLCKEAGGEAASSVVMNEALPDVMKEGVSFIKKILLQGLLNIHDVLVPADQCFCCLD